MSMSTKILSLQTEYANITSKYQSIDQLLAQRRENINS